MIYSDRWSHQRVSPIKARWEDGGHEVRCGQLMFTKQVSRPRTVPIPIVAGECSRSGNSKKDLVTGAFRGSCALHSPTRAASMSRPLPPEEIAYLEELPRRSRIRAMGVGELMRRLVSKASNDSSEEDHKGTQGE